MIFSAAAILLACTLTTGLASLPAAAAETLTPVETDTQHGLTYQKYEFERSGGPQKLFTAALDPTAEDCDLEVVLHHRERADGGYLLSTVMDTAKDYEAKTGRKVYAATNGDFFSGGSPVDSYVNGGVVYTTGPYDWKHCFGFDNKGNVAIGRMTETESAVTVTSADGSETRTFSVDAWNREPKEGGLAIYENVGQYAVKNSGKYIAAVVEGSMQDRRATGESRRTVDGELLSDTSVNIRSGEFAIVAKGESEAAQWLYENFYYGATAFVHRTPAGAFAGMEYVTGGWCILVENGVVNEKCRTDLENSGGVPADRTFFGIREDGKMMLCALDGRQPSYSKGLTVQEEAYLAKELGMKTAIELDGGGSTTFLLRQNDELKQLNYSSQGGYPNQVMRPVCTVVLVVEKEKAKEPDVQEPTPQDPTPQDPTPQDPVPADPTPQEPAEKGCGGAIGTSGAIVFGMVAVAAVIFITIRKEEK